MVQNIPNNTSTKQYMTPEQFCFWLQGLFELSPDLKKLSAIQTQMIRDHLHYVFQGKETTIFQSTPSVTTFTPTAVTSTVTYPQGIQGIGGLGSLTDILTTTVC